MEPGKARLPALIPRHNSLVIRRHPICEDSIALQGEEPESEAMKTPILATLLTTAAFSLVLSSCDSRQENAREDALEQKADALEKKADNVRKEGEAAADATEDAADRLRDQAKDALDTTKETTEARADAAEDNADAIREAAEKKADALEDEADANREAK